MLKIIEQQNKLYEQQAAMMKNQLSIMERMVQAIEEFQPSEKRNDLEELNKTLTEMADNVEDVGEKSNLTQNDFNKLAETMLGQSNRVAGSIKKFGLIGMGLSPIVGVVEKLGGGFKFMFNILKSVGNVAGIAIGSIVDLATSIITFPFKMLQGLIDLAGSGGDTGLRQALEDIRKEFGDLRKNGSEAIIDISRGLKGQLAETGLSTWRIFGNLAERLKTITEYAQNMGTAFDLVRQSFVENAERVGAYIKGLGLTQEGQRSLAETAIRSGESLQELGRQITTFAYGVGEAFGFNGKMISRDIGKMMNDFTNFGNLGIETLSNISVYARKLGVEFEKLLGVVERFDNFEQAAQGAAHLSQAFGLQLDTLSLITEQDPAARIEQLRKAFFAAGKSVENMTRQERALLAQQTGLDQNTLSLVFAQKNAATSYADIQKQSDATKKKQLSQAEAMEKLSNSIERLVKSGDFGSGGFFDRFLQGFSLGIRRSHEFRKVLLNLRQSLRIVWRSGIETGRAFVQMFPGVKQTLKALQEMFDPRAMRKKMREVVGAFKDFFKTVANDPKKALNNLLTSLHNTFFKNFDIRKGGMGLMKGFATFWKQIFRIGMAAVEIGIEALMKFIRDTFRKASSINFERILTNLSDTFAKLWDQVMEFSQDFIKNKLIPGVIKAWNFIVPAVLGVIRKIGEGIVNSGIVEKAITFVSDGIATFIRNIPNMIDQFSEFLISAVGSFSTFVGDHMKKLAPLARKAMRNLIPAILKGLQNIKSAWDEYMKKLPDILKDVLLDKIPRLFKAMMPYWEGLWEGIVNVVIGTMEGILDFIRDSNPELFKSIASGLNKARVFIEAWGKGVQNVFTNIRNFVQEAFGYVTTSITNTFTNIKSIIQGVLNFIASSMNTAASFISRINPAMAENMKNAAKGISDFSKSVGDSLDSVSSDLVGNVNGVRDQINNAVISGQSATKALTDNMVRTVAGGQAMIRDSLKRGVEDTRKSVEEQVQESVRATLEMTGQSAAVAESASNSRNRRRNQNAGGFGGSAEAVEGLENARQAISSFGSGGRFSQGQANELRKSLANVQHMLTGPSTSGETSYAAFMTEIQDRGISRLEAGATAMVESIKSVHTTIRDLKGVDLNADLRVLNDKLGLGARKKLQIDQGNLQLNVTVNVKLDVEELEETLTTRPGGSRFLISDRNPFRGSV